MQLCVFLQCPMSPSSMWAWVIEARVAIWPLVSTSAFNQFTVDLLPALIPCLMISLISLLLSFCLVCAHWSSVAICGGEFQEFTPYWMKKCLLISVYNGLDLDLKLWSLDLVLPVSRATSIFSSPFRHLYTSMRLPLNLNLWLWAQSISSLFIGHPHSRNQAVLCVHVSLVTCYC